MDFSCSYACAAYVPRSSSEIVRHFRPERTVQTGRGMSQPKCTVYVLRSCVDRTRYYTGVTSEWQSRLAAHNAARCSHTADGRPWALDVLIQFTDARRALAFERYLKSGSGSAFAKRHLR